MGIEIITQKRQINQGLRRMEMADLDNVVEIHMNSFDGFFLTFLGAAFLKELYSGIIEDPSGIIFGYTNDDRILGFVAGTDQPEGFYQRMLRHRWWKFSKASIKPILARPSIIPRLGRALSLPREISSEPGLGTLLSLAVNPDVQGTGIGRVLVNCFLEEASRRNLKRVNLSTDKHENDNINAFYKNIGFICVRSYLTPEGREMNEYLIELV